MKKMRFSITLKILSITILTLVCLLAFVVTIHSRMNTLQQEINVITHQDRKITSLANQLDKNILDMETGQRGYVITGDDRYLEPYRAGLADWENNYDELAALNDADRLQLNRLQNIKNNIEQWVEVSGEPVISMKRDGQNARIQEFFTTDTGIDQMNRIRSQLSLYREAMNENTNALIRGQEDRNQLLLELLYIAWAIIAVTAISAAWMIARSISVTARRITGTLTALSTSGDLGTRVKTAGNDEISDLGRAANQLLDTQQERVWLQEQANRMMAGYQGITQIAQLGDVFLSKTAEIIGYPYGTLYIRTQEEKEDYLTRVAVFAGKPVPSGKENVAFGDTLVGQCAKEGRLMRLEHLPADYIRIHSGLGTASPRQLILLPVRFLGEVLAVVEIASFMPLTGQQIQFLESISGHFGAALNSTISSMKISQLLEESQRLNEELQVYTEELQTQSEELQMQTDTLHSVNKKLEEKQVLAEEKTMEAERAQEELTRYAEMLQQSTQYKSEFLANMSHELRTPLNGILLLSEFLMDNHSNHLQAEEIEFSRAIHSSGQDLLALINDILDLSKVEAGKMTVEIEPVNISEIPEVILQNFGQLSRKKNIPLDIHMGTGLPDLMYTDPQRLRQIINNLLSNAFKFTAEGTVSFSMDVAVEDKPTDAGETSVQPYIVIRVTDTGIGISENKQSVIFDAFQQADGQTGRQYGGTGLGLSITRQLTTLLGGRLTLESQEGAGSTFRVYLPLKPAAAGGEEETVSPAAHNLLTESVEAQSAAAGTDNSSEYSDLLHIHVLITDDDERNLFALKVILEKYGMVVTTAGNGEQALKQLEASPAIEIILMDIMMPVMDGYETIRRIRELPSRQQTPIIALTAKAMQEDRSGILEAGATEYLSKPVNMDHLLALMKMLLSAY